MKRILPALLILLVAAACGTKKKTGTGNTEPFQGLAFIKAQVRDVDTNMYNIFKLVDFNGKSDTVSISREQFRKEAEPFLSLPDIASKETREDYTEKIYKDEELDRVVFFYTAADPATPLQREQVLINPSKGVGGEVEQIIFDLFEQREGFNEHRNLMWVNNSYFQILESRPGPGGTEQVRRTRVYWNDFPSR